MDTKRHWGQVLLKTREM